MSYGSGPPGYPPPPGAYGYGQAPPPGGYGYGAPSPGYGGPNPYQPPQAQMPGGGMLEAPGGALKWLFIAGYAGYWVTSIGSTVMSAFLRSGGGASDNAVLLAVLPLLGLCVLLLAPIAGLVWLHKSWACVPPDMRYTDAGRWVTPGEAVGYLFIPFYNLYWVFVANMGLCEAINRALVVRGGAPRAPKGLATAACIVHLVPYCNLLAGPILWLVFMFMIDGAKKELVNRTGQAAY